MATVIGIDLGTTNSVAAIYETKIPSIILTQDGDRLLPSVVAFTQNEERLVGNSAKSQLITNPENTVYSVKRLMGKSFSEIEPYLNQFTFSIVPGPDDTLRMKIKEKLFSPEEISAMILEKIKESAEQQFGFKIESAIITVPAYFNDSQRQATQNAGEIAGLNVIRIINEPTAASLAFSLNLNKKAKVLVYDFGGGTIDISVLEIEQGIIKVVATAGNCNLGGNDFDLMMLNLLKAEFKDEYHIDLSENKLAIQRILEASENAKKELSSLDACEINLPFIADSEDGSIHLSRYITRIEFENLIRAKVDETIGIIKQLLKNAKTENTEIDEILLVGGTTRIPLVQARVKEFFQKEPNKKINPDEIVAMGAAIQGAIANGAYRDMLLLDVIPLSLGVKTYGNAFTRIIEANTTIPTDRSLVFSTAEDLQTEVEVNIYQGEREIAEDNKLLGKFSLTGIKPASRGIPRIEVNFNININGILTVTAIDLSTKQKSQVVISKSGLLNQEDLQKIKKEAEKYKKADQERKEIIIKKTDILNRIYSINQFIANVKLDPEILKECQTAIKKANQGIEKENYEQLVKIEKQIQDIDHRINTLYGNIPTVITTEEMDTKEKEKKSKSDEGVDTRPLEYKEESRGLKFKKTEINPQKTKEKKSD